MCTYLINLKLSGFVPTVNCCLYNFPQRYLGEDLGSYKVGTYEGLMMS